MMVELFITIHKSSRLPIDLYQIYHLAVLSYCYQRRINKTQAAPFSRGQFSEVKKRLRGCHTHQEGYDDTVFRNMLECTPASQLRKSKLFFNPQRFLRKIITIISMAMEKSTFRPSVNFLTPMEIEGRHNYLSNRPHTLHLACVCRTSRLNLVCTIFPVIFFFYCTSIYCLYRCWQVLCYLVKVSQGLVSFVSPEILVH